MLCLLVFFFFSHFKLLFKYLCLFCFVFIHFLVFEFFVVVVFLKNSQLITKVGKYRWNMEKNQFYIGNIQSSVFVPEQEWRLSQERNLFTLVFCEDKVYNQRRLFATKIRAAETISSRTMNSSPHWLDSCVLSPLVRENSVLISKNLSFFVTKSLQSGRKATTWSYMEIIK